MHVFRISKTCCKHMEGILSLIIYKPKLIVCLFQLEIGRMPYKIS